MMGCSSAEEKAATARQGEVCGAQEDCAPGLACGVNNGAHFGRARADRVCWASSCEQDESACGTSSSPCGPNCAGATACDPEQADFKCPGNEVCSGLLTPLYGLNDAAGVCVDPSCPSNDETKCGTRKSLCGIQCICTPECSAATCASSDDGCGDVCPGVCKSGEPCRESLECPIDFACLATPDGAGICRPNTCLFKVLEPPLCGVPGAPCGEQCPT